MQNKMMKRCLAALVAIIFVSGVTFGVPATTRAIEPDPNPAGNEITRINNGETLGENNGTVVYNHGIIELNNNQIQYNENTIDVNNGNVFLNQKQIDTNYGTVTNNKMNTDTHFTPFVTDNFGTVTGNYGKVTNNYDNAGVTNFNDMLVDSQGYIENQWWSVNFAEFDGGSADFTGGFTTKQVNMNGDEKKFLQGTANPNNAGATQAVTSGVITISATNADQRITTGNQNANPPTTIGYTLAPSGNNYVLTITSITGITNLTLAQLNLIVADIEENAGGDVVVRVDNSVTITEDETGSNRATSDIAPTTGNAVTAAQISAMIESALAAAPGVTVLDIDLGNDPSLTVDSLIALCEKNNVAKRCHFTHNGMKFVLFIPVVDPTSAAYQQCKALLDAEEGKQAGPIRLSQLFKPVGFDCLGE